MSTISSASVIILNYNYGKFLTASVDSALGQSHAKTEVVVVDDGSTDNSREVIAGYGARVVPVYKANGGMGSAINAGFAASSGEIVCFLDADDVLYPDALAQAAPLFAPGVTKVHWPMEEIDSAGGKTGTVHNRTLAEGDFRADLQRLGPEIGKPGVSTSGTALARFVLENILPMPEDEWRRGADAYLAMLAAASGPIRKIETPLSSYRRHDANRFLRRTVEDKVALGLEGFDRRVRTLLEHFPEAGGAAAIEGWKKRSWWHQLDRLLSFVKSHTPPGQPMVLIDENLWPERAIAGREVVRLTEADGETLGLPADDADALARLDAALGKDRHFIAVLSPAFWWLEHYQAFAAHIEKQAQCLVDDEFVRLYKF